MLFLKLQVYKHSRASRAGAATPGCVAFAIALLPGPDTGEGAQMAHIMGLLAGADLPVIR